LQGKKQRNEKEVKILARRCQKITSAKTKHGNNQSKVIAVHRTFGNYQEISRVQQQGMQKKASEKGKQGEKHIHCCIVREGKQYYFAREETKE
jgi:hypothetical protein